MSGKRPPKGTKGRLALERGVKTCTKCGFEKPLDEFSLRSDVRYGDGRRPQCKQCMSRTSTDWWLANKDTDEFRRKKAALARRYRAAQKALQLA